MLKISLLFKYNTISYDLECKIFRVLFLYEFEYTGRFSNLR